MTLKCLYCPFATNSLSVLLDHEDKEHGVMVEELEDVDGNEDLEVEEGETEED